MILKFSHQRRSYLLYLRVIVVLFLLSLSVSLSITLSFMVYFFSRFFYSSWMFLETFAAFFKTSMFSCHAFFNVARKTGYAYIAGILC